MSTTTGFVLLAMLVLLPYQQAWLDDDSRVRLAEKSRRVGLSWGAGGECTLDAASQDGCDTWYVGYNHDMAKEFIRDCAFWARAFNLAASEAEEFLFIDEDEDGDKSILAYAITFASGWRITALSSRPTNLRGKKGHIIIDEAAFHADLKGLIKSAMAVLMWGGRSRVDIISTHNGTENYFNTLVEEVRAKKRPYSLHRITLDDALKQGLYERICLVNGDTPTPEGKIAWRENLFAEYGDDAEEELNCIPARSGGTYVSRDAIERVMIPAPVFRLALDDAFLHWLPNARKAHIDQWLKDNVAPALAKLPKDKRHYFGEDFGRTRDRTVLVPGYADQQLKLVTPFAIELLNVPFDEQRDIVLHVLERLPMFQHAAFDSTGNGSYVAEKAKQKFGEARVHCINLSEKWYSENLPPFKADVTAGKMTVIQDADHLSDITAFKVINGQPKLPNIRTQAKGEGPPRHGDAGIGYAMLHFASKQPILAYGYTAAPKPTSGFNASKGIY